MKSSPVERGNTSVESAPKCPGRESNSNTWYGPTTSSYVNTKESETVAPFPKVRETGTNKGVCDPLRMTGVETEENNVAVS